MYRIIILTAIFLFIACPVWAIDIDQINKDWREQAGIEPIQTEPVEPVHEYNFWKGQFDPWTKEDTYRQCSVIFTQLIDWSQTKQLVDTYYETNPMLGSEPSQTEIDQYVSMCIIGNYLISKILPKYWREKWQIGSCLFQLYYVNHNYNAGFGIGF